MAALPLGNGVDHASTGKGCGWNTMGGSLDGDHAEALWVARNVAYREHVQSGGFICAGQLDRVGDHAEKAQVSTDAGRVCNGLDALARLHLGMQRVAGGVANHYHQAVWVILDDAWQCMLHELAQSLAGGEAAD